MNLPDIVAQLRAAAPLFGGRVAGAADFATGLETQVWQDLPAAYVIPLDDEAEPNDAQNAIYQIVNERIGVIVEFENGVDRRGQTVTALYEPTRAGLFAALLNWNPDPTRAPRGFMYAGGHLIQFDRKRLFYQWEFNLPITITEVDGWQPDSTPLLEIDANSDPGNPPFPAKAVLPQE